jgi:hypothetical protein
MAHTSRDTTILGAGPAGLATALGLSGRSRVRIIAPTLPAVTDVARVDMVPAAFLAFLLELGVHPSQIGVHDLHDVRFIAWSGAEPEMVRGKAMAHVERPALELALLAAIERLSAVRILPGSASQLAASDERVIDATGRRAFSSTRITGLREPWIGRVFSLRGQFEKADQAFRMAALPGGYAYRMASPRLLIVGVVLSTALARPTPQDIEKYIHAAGAGWLLEGLGRLASLQAGKGGVASVQWSDGSAAIQRVGDAALARDSLSAQSLCSGLSDAVSMVRRSEYAAQWLYRQHEQLKSHLGYLARIIGHSRFHSEAPWSQYRQFLKQNAGIFSSDRNPGSDG